MSPVEKEIVQRKLAVIAENLRIPYPPIPSYAPSSLYTSNYQPLPSSHLWS